MIKEWSILNELKREHHEQHINISERARSLGGLIWLYLKPTALKNRLKEDDELQTLRQHIIHITFETRRSHLHNHIVKVNYKPKPTEHPFVSFPEDDEIQTLYRSFSMPEHVHLEHTNVHLKPIEELILRYLRLSTNFAFDCNAIYEKIRNHNDQSQVKDLTRKDIKTSCQSLLNRGMVFQANYDFYAITNEGRQYINAKHPLFTVEDIKNREEPSK